MRLAHEFLQNFCAGNQQNQALLHKHINLFLNPGVRLQAYLDLCEGRTWSSKRNSLFFCCCDHGDLSCNIHSKGNIRTNFQEDVNTPHHFRGEGREREEVVGQGKMYLYFFLTFFITSYFSPRELLILTLQPHPPEVMRKVFCVHNIIYNTLDTYKYIFV